MSPCWRPSHPAILASFVVSLLLVVTASAQTPRSAGENLLANPGFEGGLAGWGYNAQQASVVSFPLHSGSRAVRLTSTLIGWVEVSQLIPVTPLATYNASGYLYIDPHNVNSVNTPQMRIEWRDGAGVVVGASPAPACASGSWQLCASAGQAPATAAVAVVKARFYIKFPGGEAYVDDASFTQIEPPPAATATATPTETPTTTSTNTVTASPSRPASTFTPTITHTRTRPPVQTNTAAPPTRTMTHTPALTPTPTASATATATPAPPARIVINEVEYYPNHIDSEAFYEWLELHNASGVTATLTGWTISDNVSSDTIPDLILGPGAFVVVAVHRANFLENYPGYGAALVELGQPIGNGLANTGDRLILRDSTGQIVDALSYGADVTVFSPAVPTIVSRGSSIERRPAGRDTGSAGDFQTHELPSPGQAWDEEDPTATATATVFPTATPASTTTATETGTPSATPTVTDTTTPTLSATPSETVTATPTGTATFLPLETPPATPTPSATPTETALPTATSTATASATETATMSPTTTATATTTPTATNSPTSTPRTYTIYLPILVREPPPTATPSATPDPRLVTINEFLPKPDAIDWNGDGEIDSGDEWVELYNAALQPVDVSGWALDDEEDAGSPLYFLPAGTVIPARGFLLLFGSQTGINLANTKDAVRLLYRNGALLEEYRYYATWADRSFSKTTDGGHEWTIWYPPSPGRPNLP